MAEYLLKFFIAFLLFLVCPLNLMFGIAVIVAIVRVLREDRISEKEAA